MKKIMFIGVFLTLAFVSNAQKIIMDKVDSDGSRLISTSEKNLRDFTDKIVTYVSLSYNEVDTLDLNIQQWYIDMRYAGTNSQIKKGSILLIKLTNDEVIELKTKFDFIHKFDYSLKQPYILASYPIEFDDLVKILNTGVKKIRVEFFTNVFDKEWKENKMGNALKKMHELIQNRLTETPKKTLRSDF